MAEKSVFTSFKQSHFNFFAPILLLLLLLLIFFTYPQKKANYGVFLGISMTPYTAEEG